MTLTNTPSRHTLLRVEARKSFAFGVYVRDTENNPIDLTGCSLTLARTVAPGPLPASLTAAGIVSKAASLPAATEGNARFDFQATDLDLAEGEYPFTITLRTAEGYSVVVVQGDLVIVPNTEFASLTASYDTAQPPQNLTALLDGLNVLSVHVGPIIPPGMHWMTEEQRVQLTWLWDNRGSLGGGGGSGDVTSEQLDAALAAVATARAQGDADTLASAKAYTDSLVTLPLRSLLLDVDGTPFITTPGDGTHAILLDSDGVPFFTEV